MSLLKLLKLTASILKLPDGQKKTWDENLSEVYFNYFSLTITLTIYIYSYFVKAGAPDVKLTINNNNNNNLILLVSKLFKIFSFLCH